MSAMNKKLVIASVLVAAALTGIFSTTTAYATYDGGDESETNTELKSKQSNTGSGGSTNFNCGDSSIAEDTDAGLADIEACGTLSAEVLTDILGAVR